MPRAGRHGHFRDAAAADEHLRPHPRPSDPARIHLVPPGLARATPATQIPLLARSPPPPPLPPPRHSRRSPLTQLNPLHSEHSPVLFPRPRLNSAVLPSCSDSDSRRLFEVAATARAATGLPAVSLCGLLCCVSGAHPDTGRESGALCGHRRHSAAQVPAPALMLRSAAPMLLCARGSYAPMRPRLLCD